jgi:hypothetical protein
MKPDIERRPRDPMSQLYGATVKVREEVSWTTMFQPTKVPTVKPSFVRFVLWNFHGVYPPAHRTGGYATTATVL